MSQSTAEILDSLRRFVQALRSDSATLERDHDVTGAQLFVLKALEDAETLSINELAARTFTHQSSVSLVVSKLEKRQLVRRHPGTEDARRTEVELTAKGHALLDDCGRTLQERLGEGLQDLSARERTTLARLLKRVLESAGLEEGPPPMFLEDKEC